MHVVAVDLAGALLALAGFLLAFRQPMLRRAWDRYRARRGRPPLAGAGDEGADPAHYAMIISGTMMMAFGILIVAFTTIYAGTS
jgi:hypothetical protein